MQRLFLGSFLASVLLLAGLVMAVGRVVDPFGFFVPDSPDLDRSPAYTLNRSLFRTIEFNRLSQELAARGEQMNVIVGDSTSNQIDQDTVSAATGETWFNYSYGQATLLENIALLESLLEGDYPIRRIVWSLAFPRLRNNDKDEMSRSLQMARHPLWHLFTFESLRGSYYVLRKAWFGLDFTDAQLDLEQDERVEYFVYRMEVDLRGVGWPEEMFATIARLERRAEAKGIDFAYAIMPTHPRTRELFSTVFADRYARYLDFLDQRCTFDLRDRPEGLWPDGMFHDAVHLAAPYRPLLSRQFAQAVQRPCTAEPRIALPAGSRRPS